MSARAVPDNVLAELRRIVGPAGYLQEPVDVEPFLVDHRKLYRGATPLVLRPDSTAQISAILKLCNEARVGVVPVGGNTGYMGGATPSADGSQIVLSLARMRCIRSPPCKPSCRFGAAMRKRMCFRPFASSASAISLIRRWGAVS